MPAATLRYDRAVDAAEQSVVSARVRSAGASLEWKMPNAGRTYALLSHDGELTASLRDACGDATLINPSVIALAVTPSPAQALPHVVEALRGPGGLAGVRSCELAGDRVLVEFDPRITGATLVLATVDAELRRFNGVRAAELLVPLDAELLARVASDGLKTPELSPERILDVLVERAYGTR